MTDYRELVEALRDCASGDGERCLKCTYHKASNMPCDNALMTDAAAAIEALQYEIRESMQKCAECGANEPKRGKWITIRLNNGGSYTGCSCCEAPIPTDTMLDYIPESESKYCYSCGAKMEVQDDKA